jgi:hypothetical protein
VSATVPAAFQTAFARALLSPKPTAPDGLEAENGAAARRFAIHRNNVAAGLVKTLQSRFPAAEKIVGEAFFAAMARTFVAQSPPHSPILSTYGDEFPGFIAAFAPAREVAYLADVARLEAARTRAYHAADAAPIDAGRFAALDPDALDDIRVALHPSVEIVRSPHPIVTIWGMNSGIGELKTIEDWRGEDALVLRPHLDVRVRLLSPGGAAFLLALGAGRRLCEATEAAFDDNPGFDLSRNLAELVSSGVASEILVP